MSRIPITKTPKVYVGGAFIRSESGGLFRFTKGKGTEKFFANVPQCTRKDVRNAVEAAAKAGPDWAKRTPYNRGQIIYRLGEMLESRSDEMAAAITRSGDSSKRSAEREVAATVDRLIYYAGWADKYEQVLGNTNPVSGPFFNFTVAEPMGIVGIIAGDRDPLLGLMSQIVPVIVSGNVVVALASETQPIQRSFSVKCWLPPIYPAACESAHRFSERAGADICDAHSSARRERCCRRR
jgi:aldehyde dehydrogenase (NAD+)